MKKSIERQCSYQYINPIHKFFFSCGDYEEIEQFYQYLHYIQQSRGWYNADIQYLLLESATGLLSLRYLFESAERFVLSYPVLAMPMLKWAIIQPPVHQLHRIATLYMEQSTYPTQVCFFSCEEYEQAYQWLLLSK